MAIENCDPTIEKVLENILKIIDSPLLADFIDIRSRAVGCLDEAQLDRRALLFADSPLAQDINLEAIFSKLIEALYGN